MLWIRFRLCRFRSCLSKNYSATFGTAVFVFLLSSCMPAFGQRRGSEAAGRDAQATETGGVGQVGEKVAEKEKLFSGPQVGEPLPSANVWVVKTGDETSEKVDLRDASKEKPIAIAFMHEKSRPGFGLARLMSEYAAQLEDDQKLAIYMVVLTEDRSQSEQWLRLVQRYFKPKTFLSVADGGIEGPGSLGLNRLVAMTVLVVKDGVVTDNVTLTQVTDQVDGPRVLKAMAKVVGDDDPPTVEKLMPRARR